MHTVQPLRIGAIVQHARLFNIQHWREQPAAMNDILQRVAELFALLDERKVEPVLVGGIAMLQYVQGRNTEDIDLIVSVRALRNVPEIQITGQDANFARGSFYGLRINFLLAENPVFARVAARYSATQRFLEQDIRTATVEGLVLLKLYALPSLYHQGDFARVGLYENDIATLMYYHQPDIEQIERELALYVDESARVAIHDIVDDLRRRVARFPARASNQSE